MQDDDQFVQWNHPLWMRAIMRGMWLLGALGVGAPSIRAMMYLRRAFIARIQPRYFAGHTPSSQDLLVCTHAKSGTNWLLQISVQIAHRGEARFDHIHHLVPWPDCPLPTLPVTLDKAPTSPTGWRVTKTHLDAAYVPHDPEARYVVVLRDPRDTLVSSYHFLHSCLRGIFEVELGFGGWLEMHMAGLTPFDGWASHTASWWARRHEDNVLVLTYGELKADLPGAVDQVAAHMGITLTSEERAAVVRQSSFEHMKARNDAFAPPFHPIRGGEMCMIREGRSGGFGTLLTPDLEERLLDHTRAALRSLGSDFPFDASYPPSRHVAPTDRKSLHCAR